MVGARLACCAALALTLGGSVSSARRVEADDYRALWLWAGVRPQPVLARAERVYPLGGEVGGDPVRLEARHPAPPYLPCTDVWLVVRAETLAWPGAVREEVLAMLARWREAGSRVVSLQVDFDARTRSLAGYAAFLGGLRAALPTGTRLGISGLLDGSANGDPRASTRWPAR